MGTSFSSSRYSFFRSKKFKWLLAILLFLIVLRILLPYVVLYYANKNLANMKGYYGHVEDIDISLIRGAYVLKKIYLKKVDTLTMERTDFFDSRSIDLSVEWKALFKGRIVGEIVFNEPELRFVKDKVEPAKLQKDTNDFRKLLKDFMPLKVNRFQVNSGIVRYIDRGSKPMVDIQMTEVWILAQNLSNVTRKGEVLPSRVQASAKIYEGTLDFNMNLNPLAEQPTFDMNAEWKNTNLPNLNDFFQAYAKFDVNKGRFGLYTEVAAKDGRYTGYVKPVIKDLDVIGPEDYDDNVLRKFWELVVGTTGVVFTNWSEDQVATKVPLEGNFEKSKIDTWYAVVTLFRNAFVKALQPSIDNEINMASLAKQPKEKKGLIKEIFDK